MSKKTNAEEAATEVVDKPEEGSQLPSTHVDYGDDYGAGVSDVGTDEAGIPFLTILQALSPQIAKRDEKIEGAEIGMYFNTGTGELHDNVLFVPALREHTFVEWIPRKQGGGMVGRHDPDSDVVKAAIAASEEFGKYKTEGGNELAETYYVYGIICDMESGNPLGMAVLAFTSTSIKVYRKRFINRVKYTLVPGPGGKPVNPPMFAHQIVLGTEEATNGDDTWSAPTITFRVENNPTKSLLEPSAPAYQAAKALRAAVLGGAAQADFEKQEAHKGTAGEAGGSAF